LTFQTRLIIVVDLTLKRKCFKQYKKLKYNIEMRLEHQMNLTKFG